MNRKTTVACLLGALMCMNRATPAAVVWTGSMITFTDAAGSDPTLAKNQDRMTNNVWITRGSTQGIFNAEKEGGFTHFLSPKDTAWADGTTANYASLTYTDWDTWAKIDHGGPPSTVGVHAVMHLITDDIYLDVEFTSWGLSGGGFAYQRSTSASGPSNLIWTGTASGIWDVNTTANFSGNASGLFSNGDHVTFDSTGSNRAVTIAAGGVAPGSLRFSNTSAAYSLSGGSIYGASSLVVSGGGVLVLDNSNTYTGGTFVINGTLELDSVNSLASGSAITVGSSASFTSHAAPLQADGISAATPVPEPGTSILLVAGAALIAMHCRRRSSEGRSSERGTPGPRVTDRLPRLQEDKCQWKRI